MVLDQIYIDILRVFHLTFFAAGMGTGLYLDFRTFQNVSEAIGPQDVEVIDKIHVWITWAFVGLWATGLVLIYVRTNMDIAQFTPKLWMKIGLMVLMTLNVLAIGGFVIPRLKQQTGRSLAQLKCMQLSAVSQFGIVSMFCWTSGLALGSSVYLKTAGFDVLLPVAIGWFAACTVIGQTALLSKCWRARGVSAS